MSDSERSQGGSAAIFIVLALGLVLFLGFGCLGAGFLLFARSSPKLAAPVSTTATSPPQANTGPGFAVRSAGATRLADGSYNIFLVGKYSGGGTLQKLDFSDARLVDVPDSKCDVRLPPGPPYPRTVDIVVHTRPLPADTQSVQLSYNFEIEGREGFAGTFGMSSSGTIKIDLKPAAKIEATDGAEKGTVEVDPAKK